MSDGDPRELLPLYALHALSPEEERAVEAYLAAHPEALGELEEYREAAAALALGAPQLSPPPGLEERVLARVRALEGGSAPNRATARPAVTRLPDRRARPANRGLTLAALFAGAAALVAVGLLGFQVSRLSFEAQAARRERDAIVAAIADPGSRTLLLAAPTTNVPVGRAVLLPGGQVLLAHSLGASPQGRVWQAWVIRRGQTAPSPLGTFSGSTQIIVVPEDAQAVAISEEPPGGSQTPTTIRAVGQI